MSMGQIAHACNQLCDNHAEKFMRSAVGKFPPEAVRQALKNAVLFDGMDIRLKTAAEKRAECKAYDKAHGIKARSPKIRRARSVNFSHDQRIALVAKVHAVLSKHATTADACDAVGVGYTSFIAWRSRYNMMDVQLPGRSYPNRKGAAV